jgi:hypothetical protein
VILRQPDSKGALENGIHRTTMNKKNPARRRGFTRVIVVVANSVSGSAALRGFFLFLYALLLLLVVVLLLLMRLLASMSDYRCRTRPPLVETFLVRGGSAARHVPDRANPS